MINEFESTNPVKVYIANRNIYIDTFLRLWYRANLKSLTPQFSDDVSEEVIETHINNRIQKFASIDISEIIDSPNRDAMLIEAINIIYGTDEENEIIDSEFKSMYNFTKQSFIVAHGVGSCYEEMISGVLGCKTKELAGKIKLCDICSEEIIFMILVCRLYIALS